MHELIGISGKKNSGKDLVFKSIIFLSTDMEVTEDNFRYFEDAVFTDTPVGNGRSHILGYGDLTESPPYRNKKFASKIKEVTALMFGCRPSDLEDRDFKEGPLPADFQSEGAPVNTYRSFMQKLGTDFGRGMIHDDLWVNGLFVDFEEGSKWVITDLRFPNELEAIRRRGGFTIRIDRPGFQDWDTHPSETALDDVPCEDWGLHILNNGSKFDVVKKINDALNG